MSVKQFLTSFTFFKNLFLGLLIIVAFMFLFMKSLNFLTHHGEEITVPNLNRMSVEKAEETLDDLDLDYLILDTLDYNPAYPKYAIMQQDPKPGSKVKEDRKIYIRLNAGSYEIITLPDFIQKTYRHTLANMKRLGLLEGKIIYKPDMARDMVLEVRINGKAIAAGSKIRKNSTLDLVLGDGSLGYTEEPVDSLSINDTEDIDTQIQTPPQP